MSSKYLNNLSQDELIKIIKEEREKNKKLKKERSIILLKNLQKQNENLSQPKLKSKSIHKSKPKPKSKSKSIPKSKSKSFQYYYQECIKGKEIPKDIPIYFRKALERVMKEYEKGIILEKSALTNFAEKYVIKGIPGILKDFLRNHRNTKVRMILVCEMEEKLMKNQMVK